MKPNCAYCLYEVILKVNPDDYSIGTCLLKQKYSDKKCKYFNHNTREQIRELINIPIKHDIYVPNSLKPLFNIHPEAKEIFYNKDKAKQWIKDCK